jgi:hypothetical protein
MHRPQRILAGAAAIMAAAALAACAGGGVSASRRMTAAASLAAAQPVRIEVSRPIGAPPPGPDGVRLARREVAWSREVLSERAPIRTKFDVAPDNLNGPTPGLLMAGERLRARDAISAKLRERIDQQPAADAIPGVSPARTVQEFRQREPAVSRAVSESLRRDLVERVYPGSRDGEAVVEGRLPLARIAQSVWESGGGRRLDDRALEVRARDGAMDEARMRIREAMRRATFADGVAVEGWLLEAPDRAARFEAIAARAREVRSEPVTVGGERRWVVELEVSPELLDEMRYPVPPPAPKPARK